MEFYNSSKKLHRLVGPAVVSIDGDKEWWRNGKLHNENGYAVFFPGIYAEYYLDGVEYSEYDYYKTIYPNEEITLLFMAKKVGEFLENEKLVFKKQAQEALRSYEYGGVVDRSYRNNITATAKLNYETLGVLISKNKKRIEAYTYLQMSTKEYWAKLKNGENGYTEKGYNSLSARKAYMKQQLKKLNKES